MVHFNTVMRKYELILPVEMLRMLQQTFNDQPIQIVHTDAQLLKDLEWEILTVTI